MSYICTSVYVWNNQGLYESGLHHVIMHSNWLVPTTYQLSDTFDISSQITAPFKCLVCTRQCFHLGLVIMTTPISWVRKQTYREIKWPPQHHVIIKLWSWHTKQHNLFGAQYLFLNTWTLMRHSMPWAPHSPKMHAHIYLHLKFALAWFT